MTAIALAAVALGAADCNNELANPLTPGGEISISLTENGSGSGSVASGPVTLPNGGTDMLDCDASGLDTGAPCTFDFVDGGGGGVLVLAATPETGSQHFEWGGTCTTNADPDDCVITDNGSTLSLTFAESVDADFDLTVTFLPDAHGSVIDPAGTWDFDVTVTVATGACDGEEGDFWSEEITINRTVGPLPYDVSAEGFLGVSTNALSGTFDAGNRLLVTGSYDEDGGTTTPTHTLVATSADTMEGIEAWSWSGPGGSCPGSQSIVTATRIP